MSSLLPFTPPPPNLTPRTKIPPQIYTHPSAILLELSKSSKELHIILPLILKSNLYNHQLFQTKLISLFTKFSSLNDAVKVFDSVESKTPPMYHTLLKGYAQNGNFSSAFNFFVRMKCDGIENVVYNFTYLLRACGGSVKDVRIGKQVHGQMVLCGCEFNLLSMTCLMSFYLKCGCLRDSEKVFDRMVVRDLVCWNTVIGGFVKNGMGRKGLEFLRRMQVEGGDGGKCCKPDLVTVVSVLPACGSLGCLRSGKEVHGYVLRHGLESYVNVGSALVDMYGKCGKIGDGRKVFDRMGDKTVVSWNSMIDGYAQSGDSEEALSLFEKMVGEEGLRATNVTVMGALHACGDLGDVSRGKFVHEMVDRLGLDSDVSVVNSLISMYCKCRRVDLAAELFRKLNVKTLVSWNAMILGYAQNGRTIEAISLFCKMQRHNMKCDSFTLVSVITAVAELSVLRQAKWIHGLTIRTCLDKNVFVMTALVDMYAKCGAVHTAKKMFDRMGEDKHVTTWNAMIDGYGTHGFGKEAIKLFDEMCEGKYNVSPNDVTFLCVISACSHAGLVNEGRRYFSIMKEKYGLEPGMDHYGAMVDLLGRAGQLNEAWDFIQKMPVEPGMNVFGAMLGACKIHKNVDLGEKAADKLFELQPKEGGYHVLLANIYAIASMWDKVAKVRTLMEKSGIQKTPGCSSVDLRSEVHTFYSGSTKHPQSDKIYEYLEKLIERIKLAGYIPDTSSIHDVEDDIQEQLLNTHSEKLAISFGLISTKPGTPIHIRKNLRVCGDCHNATKYISLVTEREIIVRDMHRFHHFKNGTCSCGDYW